jgi:lysophospholipase L1-like esterase
MLECLILGDSIAVGIAQHRPECAAIAKGGISSYSWNNANITKPLGAKTVVISLGANDSQKINTRRELETLRELIKADLVFWILPHNKPSIHPFIRELAEDYRDVVLPITQISPDNIHPTTRGYKILANQTR